MSKIILAILVFLIVFSPSLLGQSGSHGESGYSLEAGVDKQQGYVGDRLTYTLVIKADSSTVIDSLDIRDKLGKFEIKSRDYSVAGYPEGLEHTMKYTLSAYETGTLWIPSISVRFRFDDGSSVDMSTDSVQVVVESLAASDSLADIKGLKPQVYFGSKFPWPYVAVAAVIIAAIVIWFARRRKEEAQQESSEEIDDRPPWVIAEERLKELRASGLLDKGEFKQFYLQLTEILRWFIEKRYGVDALDRTTYELRTELKAISLDSEQYDMLFKLFDSADLVKFAKFIPSVSQSETDFQHGWQFVKAASQIRAEVVGQE